MFHGTDLLVQTHNNGASMLGSCFREHHGSMYKIDILLHFVIGNHVPCTWILGKIVYMSTEMVGGQMRDFSHKVENK